MKEVEKVDYEKKLQRIKTRNRWMFRGCSAIWAFDVFVYLFHGGSAGSAVLCSLMAGLMLLMAEKSR